MRFQDIPQLIPDGTYAVDVSWSHLEGWLDAMARDTPVVLEPDFQRGRVWTPAQQTAFVEFALQGGRSGDALRWNQRNGHVGASRQDPLELVDGLQRLTAVRAFLANAVPVFDGAYFRDFSDRLSLIGPMFRMHVNALATRAEVLQWYLQLNAGGTPHTPAEIARVAALLRAEPDGAATREAARAAVAAPVPDPCPLQTPSITWGADGAVVSATWPRAALPPRETPVTLWMRTGQVPVATMWCVPDGESDEDLQTFFDRKVLAWRAEATVPQLQAALCGIAP